MSLGLGSGTRVVNVVVDDVGGSAEPDVVVVAETYVRVYEGTGGGALDTGSPTDVASVGSTLSKISEGVLAQMDGDGTRIDLFLVHHPTGSAWIGYLAGPITAASPLVHIDTTSVPTGTLTARPFDVNRDGLVDIVGYASAEVLVWVGTGTGVWGEPVVVGVGSGAAYGEHRIQLADLFESGALDMVATSVFDNTLFLYRSNGSALGFDPPVTVASFPQTYLSDGFFNLEIVHILPERLASVIVANSGDLFVALYTPISGSGTAFDETMVDTSLSDVASVQVIDINGDGALDLFFGAGTAITLNSPLGWVALNAGDGTFPGKSHPITVASSTSSTAAVLARLDPAGPVALVAAISNPSSSVYVYDSLVPDPPLALGSPRELIDTSAISDNALRIAAADLSGDGILDMILGTDQKGLYWATNDGAGGSVDGTSQINAQLVHTRGLVVLDDPGSGVPHLFATGTRYLNTRFVSWFPGTRQPDNSVTWPSSPVSLTLHSTGGSSSTAVFDIGPISDFPHITDVVTSACNNPFSSSTLQWHSLADPSTPHVISTSIAGVCYRANVAVADVVGNGAGHDIVIQADAVTLFVNEGNGSFASGVEIAPAGTGLAAVSIYSPGSSSDGVDLVVVTTNSVVGYAWTGTAPRYLAASATSLFSLSTSSSTYALTRAGDLDSDGDTDLVVVDVHWTTTPSLYVAINDGGGSFTRTHVFGSSELNSYRAADVTLGDFDNDGVIDLYVALSNSNFVLISQLMSAGTLPSSTEYRMLASETTVNDLYQAMLRGSSCWTRTVVVPAGAVLTGCSRGDFLRVPAGPTVTVASSDPAVPFVVDCGSAGGVLFEVVTGATLAIHSGVIRSGTTGSEPTASSVLRVSESGAELRLINSRVEHCSNRDGDLSQVYSGHGGAVTVVGGAVLTLENTTMVHNTARLAGGAIAVIGNDATVRIRSSVLEGNTALGLASLQGGGGAVAVFGARASLTITRGTHINNNIAAAGAGGALLVRSSATESTVQLDTVALFNNTAAVAGGAVAVLAGPVDVTPGKVLLGHGVSVTACSAGFGGAVAAARVDHATLPDTRVSTSLSILDNSAASSSPAVVFESSSVVVAGCSAKYGGVFFVCGAGINATARADPFSGGTASVSGLGGFACLPLPGPGDASAWLNTGSQAPGPGVIGTPPVALHSFGTPASRMSGEPFGAGGIRAVDGFGADVADDGLTLTAGRVTSPAASAGGVVLSGAEAGAAYTGPADGTALDELVVSAPAAALPLAAVVIEIGMSGAASGTAPAVITVEVTACSPGFGGSVDGVTGAILCLACGDGLESNETSVGGCTPIPACPENALTNGTATNCVCKEGFFKSSTASPVTSANLVCSACPDGAVCSEGLDAPVPARGFFAAPDGTFVRCKRPGACLGLGQGCAAGTTGYQCGTCVDGWHTTAEGRCELCPPSSDVLLAMMVAAAVVLAVVTVVVVVFAVRSKDGGRGGKVVDETTSGQDEEPGGAQSGGTTARSRLRRRTTPPSLSMVLVSLQICGLLSNASLRWPSSSSSLFEVANVSNGDMDVFATQCSLTGSFHATYAVGVGLLVLILVLACGLAVVARPWVSALRTMTKRGAVEAVTFTLAPLLYIPMARSTFVLFDCTRLPNGDIVLDADPGVACFDAAWWSVLPVGMVGALFVVGLPPLFLLQLARAKVGEPDVDARLGALYGLYRLPYYFAGVVELGRRLLLVVVGVFFSSHPLVQLNALLILLLSHAVYLLTLQPYFFVLYNKMDVALTLTLTGLTMVGGASYASNAGDNSSVINVLVFAALGALAVVCVIAIVVDLSSIARSRHDSERDVATRRAMVDAWLAKQIPDLAPGDQAALRALLSSSSQVRLASIATLGSSSSGLGSSGLGSSSG